MKQDILIIGAGPAGLCFAREMAETGLNITLIEKQSEDRLADPSYDGREIALTHFSRKIMGDLGLWDHLSENSISLLRKARVLNGNSPYALSFDHQEAGEETLGFLVSNNRIRKAAYQSLANFENVRLLDQKEVSAVSTNGVSGQVTLKNSDKLEAQLVVAADSRFSETRRMMGIPASMLDFGRTCVVCTMNTEYPHDETAYECFHYDRTLAILPLNGNQVSVVITLPSSEAPALLAQDKNAFNRDIEQRIQKRFGTMDLSSAFYPYPLVATFAKRFYAERFALIGDAAVGMHPVTAHGFNLGLRSAHILASEIKSALSIGNDFASTSTLGRYSHIHRKASKILYHGTNALVKLYTTNNPATKLARQALLHLGNHIKPAKHLIMEQLTEKKPLGPIH
ncbi:MAG: 5-demethoxyubiquinol-8 5-hydroxylase UbiM [Sneathiellales bacterium]|nr:5-demethoxyubiquinol-8 5-hydroxylase UbiM [Sneathiellales bacterium]